MDPTACMMRIIEATDNRDTYERNEAIADLTAWLASGGFAPELDERCMFDEPPAPTTNWATWDDRAWARWWLSSGALVANWDAS